MASKRTNAIHNLMNPERRLIFKQEVAKYENSQMSISFDFSKMVQNPVHPFVLITNNPAVEKAKQLMLNRHNIDIDE